MLKYIRQLMGSLHNQSDVHKFGPGAKKSAAKSAASDEVTIPDLRTVMESVYRTETHLEVFTGPCGKDGPVKDRD